MVSLTPGITFQLAMVIALVPIFFLGFLLLLRKICVKRKTLLRFLNLKIWCIILLAIWILSFVLLTKVAEENASTNISPIFHALDNCVVLAAKDRFYDAEYKKWGSDFVKIDDANAIDIIRNIITGTNYNLRAIALYPDLSEFIDLLPVYQCDNRKQLIQFTIIKGGILEIWKRPFFWRYESTDKNLLDNIRKAIGFPDNIRYRKIEPPAPHTITLTEEELSQWVEMMEVELDPNEPND